MTKDYYNTLGVDKKANKDELKKAFYKLAAKHHPDKGGDEAKFKEVNEAYQVLSDDGKRKEYDMYGQTFSGAGSNAGGQQQGSGFGGFGGFNPNDFQNMQFDMDDLGDIFGDMFSGFGGGFGGVRERRGRDMSLEIEIPFKDSIFGTERKVMINRTSKCVPCKATGGDVVSGKVICTKCNGKGKVYETKRTMFGAMQTQKSCSDCDATGTVYKDKCKDCKGHGVKDVKVEVSITVPAGIQNGEMVKMTEMGEAVRGGVSGDMFIKVRVQNDKVWKREGYDLVMNHKIKLSDALLGVKHKIDALDGQIELVVEGGIGIGEVVRVAGRGVPVPGRRSRGDILINLNIEMPRKLSSKVKKLVEEMRGEGI
jgi:molecular chaperone DnaJ